MVFTAKYIDSSLYYLPWKTKFIEAFCIPYAHAKNLINNFDNSLETLEKITHIYLKIFYTSLKILQKKITCDSTLLKPEFNLDIIRIAKEMQLISNENLFYEVLNFYAEFYSGQSDIFDFKFKYMEIMDEFSAKFKLLTAKSGFRQKEYVIYDNSNCLWGIKEKYYEDLIKLFLSIDKLKIVRIFGSRVTQDYKEFSDLDLICEGTYSNEEYKEMISLIQDFETPYVIDLYDIKRGRKPFIYRNFIRSNLFYMRSHFISDNYISIINK